MSPELTHVLGLAYKATVLFKGPIQAAYVEFDRASANPAFVEEARAELERVNALAGSINGELEKRCFISAKTRDFLVKAFERKGKM